MVGAGGDRERESEMGAAGFDVCEGGEVMIQCRLFARLSATDGSIQHT